MGGFYQGSRILNPLSTSLGLPLDQVNFMVGEILALFLAIFYRVYLHPRNVGTTVRHAVATITGLTLGFFCFGKGFFHMLLQSTICYLIMLLSPPRLMHKIVMGVAMGYLSAMHIYRMIYDYGGYVLDVTGPLMICTQKLTSMAFSLHDGLHKAKESLSSDQRQQAIRRMPNILCFSSYVLAFQGLLAGPLCFYSDYIKFVEGTQYIIPEPDQDTELKAEPVENHRSTIAEEPSPNVEVVQKVTISIICLGVGLGLAPIWPVVVNADKQFVQSHGFWFRFYFLMVSVPLSKARYYFAWKFGEAINNAAGLGFNGYDEKGQAKWDLITNARIRKIEGATSLKLILDNWNIQTALWLRRVCYDRAPSVYRTTMTYSLSAMWHGFYPGYAFTFLGGALWTSCSRLVRKLIRPIFLVNPIAKAFYDVVTWFFAQLSLNYLVVPFCVLEFWPTVYFYTRSMYWFLHIGVIGTIIILTATKPWLRRLAPAPP